MLDQFVSRDLTRRNLPLDALRGLMIIGMILVNHSPVDTAVFSPLVHAAWHGWSLADTIFPGFLFSVGVSISLAMVDAHGLPPAPTKAIHGKILRRFALLLVLNFLLVNFPYYELAKLHFHGTLALIAWCYVIVAFVHLHSGWRTQLALACLALIGQWAAYALVPVPGFGRGVLLPEANAAQFLDHVAFSPLVGPTLYGLDGAPTLLPMLGAVATTLIGLLAGHWLSAPRGLSERVNGLFAVGLGLLMLGEAWNSILPVNKQLWSASFVVFMAGISMQLLAGLYWITELTGRRAWVKPLQIAGVNALFFYVFAQCLQRLLVYGRVHTGDGSTVRLRALIYEHYFAHWPIPEVGSLAYVLVFLTICYGVVLVLYRKRLFIKL